MMLESVLRRLVGGETGTASPPASEGALGLALVAVDGRGGEAGLAEMLGDAVCTPLDAGANDGADEIRGAEDLSNNVALLVL